MRGASFTYTTFVGCTFDEVDMSDVLGEGATFNKCNFQSTTLLHADFTASEWIDVHFNEVDADQCNFTNASFDNIEMQSCAMPNADFSGVRWENAVAKECNFSRANFSHANSDDLEHIIAPQHKNTFTQAKDQNGHSLTISDRSEFLMHRSRNNY